MKNQTTAGLLAIFLGVLGVHKFYLRQYFWGVIYIMLGLLGVGIIISIIEGIWLLAMSPDSFDERYNEVESRTSYSEIRQNLQAEETRKANEAAERTEAVNTLAEGLEDLNERYRTGELGEEEYLRELGALGMLAETTG